MQLSDASTVSADSSTGFSWSNLGSGLLDLAKTAAVAASQYKIAQYASQNQQAAISAGQNRSAMPNFSMPGSSPLYQYNASGAQYPQAGSSLYSQQPAPSANLMPVILIASVGLVAAFILMGKK